MKPDVPKNRTKAYNIHDLFDEILARHLERLIGTRYGIEGLPLNLLNISCLIMILERENEIKSGSSSFSGGYTIKTLSRELEEIGFDLSDNMNLIILEMIKKNYIKVNNNRITPRKPAMSICQILDNVFPGMTGMNLVAYLVQTMDEVHSERKDLESAVNQFDQTLKMQGVFLKRDDEQPPNKTEPTPSAEQAAFLSDADEPPKDTQQVIPKEMMDTSEILRRFNAKRRSLGVQAPQSGPKILSSGYFDKTEIKKVNFGKTSTPGDDPAKTVAETHAQIESEASHLPDQDKEVAAGPSLPATEAPETAISKNEDTARQSASIELESDVQTEDLDKSAGPAEPEDTATLDIEAVEAKDAQDEKTLTDTEPQEEAKDVKDELNPTDDELQEEEKDAQDEKTVTDDELQEEAKDVQDELNPTDAESQEGALHIDDDFIESRITAFEEDLAMECPMCKKAKVQAANTAKGKSYYKCSNKTCNFISWGIPHHILCPRCNNPFLIESYKDEKTILKCPRATCRYWQPPPWEIADNTPEKAAAITRKPRRKVKRRRVVRRKK